MNNIGSSDGTGMRHIALTISYEGTNYHGWQCQPNQTTVQEVLTAMVGRVVDHEVKLTAAARTDAGVHAFGQVVNFVTMKGIPLVGLVRGVNSLLPRDIRVLSAREVDPDFHARYSAKQKTYIYSILNTPTDSPFLTRYAWHLPHAIDARAMNNAVKTLRGRHDFSAFKKKNEVYRSAEREVIKAGVRRAGNMVYVVLGATGFLRYMVRNIVGTLVLVGTERLTAGQFQAILVSGQRELAGPTAPAHGLFLRSVSY
jgi:tRNA pseudouridine38-40 synthase